jgi:hypothetical protein
MESENADEQKARDKFERHNDCSLSGTQIRSGKENEAKTPN